MGSRSLVSLAVLIVGITIPTVAAVAAGATGGIGVRLLATPRAAPSSPLLNGYITGVIAPGKSIRRRVEIGNSTNRAVSVAVYPAGASIRHGVFTFAAGRLHNDLARWTTLSASSIRLKPGGMAVVTVVVTVPRSTSAGERHAVVWAEVAAPSTSGVRLVNRVGIRLYLTVGAGGGPPAGFRIGELHAGRTTGGAPLVRAMLRNTGARTLAIAGSLTLSKGPGGTSAGPFPATLTPALSPGGSAEVRVQLDRRLPPGSWRARLQLHSGRLEREAVATLGFPRERVTPAGSSGGWTWQFRDGLLLFNILGATAVTFVSVVKIVGLRRRRSPAV
jgi:hypothetical protein